MPASKDVARRPDIVVDDHAAHSSRKVARDSATKQRGGTVTVGDRTGFGGKELKGMQLLRHDGDGGVRDTQRPMWLEGDVAMKKLDLHKFGAEAEAVAAVERALAKLDASVALEIVCGAGTHTDVNKYGSKVKETGDWKNKQCPLFFTIKKKLIQSADFSSGFNHWIPTDNTNSSIYVRSRNGADRPHTDIARCSYDDVALSIEQCSTKKPCPNATIDTKARDEQRLEEFAKLKAKEQAGEKLSNKDKRRLGSLRQQCADIEERRKSGISEPESEDGDMSRIYDAHTC